jgi:hypothetical protein
MTYKIIPISLLLLLLCFTSPSLADLSWWVGPYDRKDRGERKGRVCAADRYTSTVYAEGGEWREIEILGNKCLFKLRSSASTIAIYAADADFQRLPKNAMGTALSDLTNPQKTALRNFITGLGYSLAELQARFPNDLGTYTLGDVIRFMASRRKNITYNSGTDTIEEGSADLPGLKVDAVNGGVQ